MYTVVAYVPVLHSGYFRFFERHRNADGIAIFGDELIAETDYLRKEIRALPHELVWKALQSWGLGPRIAVATRQYLQSVNLRRQAVLMPDEDVCRQTASKYLGDTVVEFESVFLRWDRVNTLAEHAVVPDRTISITQFDRDIMAHAFELAEHSSDWWRQVGAIAVREGKALITAFNQHMPSPHTPYVHGDPRNAFFKGVNIELGTALHAEKGIIATAAKRGIALDGAFLYVSTFPCPPCAKAVVAAGFRRCYYAGGYAMLDGESILKESGVEVVYVEQK